MNIIKILLIILFFITGCCNSQLAIKTKQPNIDISVLVSANNSQRMFYLGSYDDMIFFSDQYGKVIVYDSFSGKLLNYISLKDFDKIQKN